MMNLAQVARQFRVSRETVAGWIRSGELEAINVAPVGSNRMQFRIDERAVRAFEGRRKIAPTVNLPADFEKVTQFV